MGEELIRKFKKNLEISIRVWLSDFKYTYPENHARGPVGATHVPASWIKRLEIHWHVMLCPKHAVLNSFWSNMYFTGKPQILINQRVRDTVKSCSPLFFAPIFGAAVFWQHEFLGQKPSRSMLGVGGGKLDKFRAAALPCPTLAGPARPVVMSVAPWLPTSSEVLKY